MHKSFILDFNMVCSFVKSWKNIVNHKILRSELNICYLEEHNIKPEDYSSYYNLYHRFQNKNFTITNLWGETISPYCIDWIITVENIVKQNYGNLLMSDENIPPYYEFINDTIQNFYFPKYESSDLLYQFITKYSSLNVITVTNF